MDLRPPVLSGRARRRAARRAAAHGPSRRASALARLGVMVLAVAVLAGPAVTSAHADDLDDRKAAAQAEQRRIEAQREDLQADLEDTNAALAKAVLDLNTIEAKLPVAQADLDAANAKVASTQREQELLAQRLSDARAEEASLGDEVDSGAKQVASARTGVAELARSSLRGQGSLTGLGVVTGAQSPEQYVADKALARTVARTQTRELAAMQKAQAVAKNRAARLAAVRERVADLKTQADAKVVEAKAAQRDAADKKAQVDRLLAQQQSKKSTIEKEKQNAIADLEANEAQLQHAKSQVADYVAQIKKREAEEAKRRAAAAKKAAQNGTKGGSSSSGSGSSSGSSSGGALGLKSNGVLAWPVANTYVTSSFGMRLHPILGYYRMHTGVDLHAPCGTPIHAAAAGYVSFAGWDSGYGNRVVVDHGNYKSYRLLTTYNHMERYVVHVGQHVSQGQVVGYAGDFGLSTACHLHFEVMENSTYVNPMNFL